MTKANDPPRKNTGQNEKNELFRPKFIGKWLFF